jgi:DNA-binding response OmpR family regulator
MLVRCPLIENIDVKYDDEHCLIIIGNRILHFSPTEYKLVNLLLIHRIVTEVTLLEALSLQQADKGTSKFISKYMNKVRSKIKPYGLQINRIHSYGYILLSSLPEKCSP